MTRLTEIIFVERIKKGDFHAFEELFEEQYAPLCNFAYLFLKDYEASEDLVSDFFVSLWQKRRHLKVKDSLKSYMYVSIRNAVISYKRKSSKILFDDIEKTLEYRSASTPETLLLKKELQEKLDSLMETLPMKSGLVFRLKKVDGMTYREISEVLNISERTVENHVASAVKKLRELVLSNPELYTYIKNSR